MSSLFKTSTTQAAQPSPLTGLSLQSSGYGKPLPVLLGTRRVSPQVIWYGAFEATAAPQASSGGKGGLFGSPSPSSTTYTYSASFALALCEGPIQNVGQVYINKSISTLAEAGFSLFTGTYPQAPWSYLVTNFIADAYPYNGTAYVAAANYSLGSSASLPGHNFEVSGPLAGSAPEVNAEDADAGEVISFVLTDPHCGVTGFSYLDSALNYSLYTLASGLVISALYDSQQSANTYLSEIAKLTNSEFVWSGDTLRIVPYGDQPVMGNGVAWNPSPIEYDLTDDDFLPTSNGTGSGSSSADSPILIMRKAASDSLNQIILECLDRDHQYNAVPVEAKDQAGIDQYGLRGNGATQAHLFCEKSVAQISAQLLLQRQSISNTYYFTTDYRYLRLDCMDYVTLTHAGQGLDHVQVRLTDIVENDDDTFSFTAEEVLEGVSSPALYSFQQSQGFAANFNVDPGDCQVPLIFEPTDELAGGLEIWLATAGGDVWGGCEVWVSNDDINFVKATEKFGPSRYGKTTSSLASVPVEAVPPTIDQSSILGVDISASKTKLFSASSVQDALNLNTLAYVGGEYISYQTATLTGTGKYNLNYLIRGALGSPIGGHVVGENFAQLDKTIARVPYRQDQIGQKIYIKLLSLNIYGGTRQSLADVGSYSYTITGLALSSPLPPVQNVRTVFEAGFSKIWWQEVDDFRSGITYIVRKGPSFEGGQDLGTLAHPPFVAFGAGTYWIMPTCQPVSGLIVFGDHAVSIVVQGNMLTTNIVQTQDFQALGWPGIYDGIGKEGVDPTAFLRLTGSADVLSDPSILINPDILNSGLIHVSGVYTADASTMLNVGYVADCYVNITWQSAGIPIGSNVLADNDILNNPDVLSAGSGIFVSVWIEVRIATASADDMFQPTDMFDVTDVPDLFKAGILWGDWQRYVPGVYRAQYIEYRALFATLDVRVIAYLTALVVQVSIPARIDHYVGNNVGTGGITIVFMPDDAIVSKPFNGGPLVGGTNNHPLPTVAMAWSGNSAANYVIDNLTLSQVIFHFEDTPGHNVAVTGVTTVVEGY